MPPKGLFSSASINPYPMISVKSVKAYPMICKSISYDLEGTGLGQVLAIFSKTLENDGTLCLECPKYRAH